MKKLFDFFGAAIGILLLSPLFIVIPICILLDSRGSVFFRQKRVGRNNVDFTLYKFRSMRNQKWAPEQLITVGSNDPRITRFGRFLRQYKIDELPQLFNVLFGDMSFVGPRPLVRQQTEIYPEAYRRVLEVRPGITSPASIVFSDEDQLLGEAERPEKYFAEVLMPAKIRLNIAYVDNQSFLGDMQLILKTVLPCLRPNIQDILTPEEYERLYGPAYKKKGMPVNLMAEKKSVV